MTVLQLGPYPPPHGGVQTNLVAIRQHLRRHGISAPVINLTRHRRVDHDEVFYPQSAFQVLRLLLSLPADIVHLHIGGRLRLRLLAIGLLASLIPRCRMVLTLHSGGYPSSEEGKKVGWWSIPSFMLRRFDALIAVNAEIAALFRRVGVHPSRITLICPYAPVSLSEDAVLPDRIHRFLSAHSPVLTTVGALEPEYDIPLQIEALKSLRERFPDAGLIVIGGGSLEGELRTLIESQLDGEHILLCGDVPHQLTIRTVAESDAFLRTTLYDGDAVSVREALQLGVPAVVTDNGMRPAGVFLIARSDPRSVCAAVESALRAPEAPISGENATRQLDEVLDLYSTLLGRDIRAAETQSFQFRNATGKT